MAVLIEAISVVVRRETIANKYRGGLDQYIEDCPNRTLCMDEDIVSVQFMTGRNAFDFVGSLEHDGFRYVVNNEYDEIAVVDQFLGITLPCEWLEFLNIVIFKGDLRVKACNIMGNPLGKLALPAGWVYENSLSKLSIVTDKVNFALRMTFLRKENGFDVFLDKLTEKEVYMKQTIRRNANA